MYNYFMLLNVTDVCRVESGLDHLALHGAVLVDADLELLEGGEAGRQ
jgi:hypothetical protein